MPLATVNGRTIFFAHVPKTGGSSVEDYMIRRFGKLSIRECRDDNSRKRDIIQSVSHMSAADLTTLLPPNLDYAFAIVRDPLNRLKSEYGFQSGISRASRLGFSTWLKVVLGAASQDPRIYENHIRPQIDLLPEGAEVFKLEDGLDNIIPRLDEISGTVFPESTVGHLLKRTSSPIKVTKQDVEATIKFYAADYEHFDYPLPDPQSFPNDPLNGLRSIIAAPLSRAVVSRHRSNWLV
ncbi:MAG: hypothetical protein ACI9Y1_000703 [Lentisphaeria bacterium]|jgi:hypothetical protein